MTHESVTHTETTKVEADAQEGIEPAPDVTPLESDDTDEDLPEDEDGEDEDDDEDDDEV